MHFPLRKEMKRTCPSKKNESQRLSGASLLVGFDKIEPSEPVPKPGSASSFNCLSSSFRSTISSYQARRLAVPNSAKVNGYFNRPIFDQRPAFECFWYLADLAYSLGIALWQLPRVAESATPTPSTSSVTGAGVCSWNGNRLLGFAVPHLDLPWGVWWAFTTTKPIVGAFSDSWVWQHRMGPHTCSSAPAWRNSPASKHRMVEGWCSW